jgi:hypothetical protein
LPLRSRTNPYCLLGALGESVQNPTTCPRSLMADATVSAKATPVQLKVAEDDLTCLRFFVTIRACVRLFTRMVAISSPWSLRSWGYVNSPGCLGIGISIVANS